MDDKLLARADRAIRDSQFIRAQARENVLQTKMVVARVKGTLQWARSFGVTGHPQIAPAMADMMVARENPQANAASGSSHKT